MPTLRHTALVVVSLIAACGSGTGRPTGPEVDPPDTIRTITGLVRYFATGPNLNAFDSDGRLTQWEGLANGTFPLPADHILVEVRDPTGALVGTGITNSTGRYNIDINYGPRGTPTQVSVKAIAQISLPFGTAARVLPDEFSVTPYSKEIPLGGDPSERVIEVDVTVGIDEGAAAFHMLQTIWTGFQVARPGITNTSLPDLDVIWARGNGEESFFEAVPSRGRLTVAGGITGDPTSNVDAWDSPKLMRLFGEYLLGFFIHMSVPEGEVTTANLVPNAAWREGFLDFWACMARGSSIYWDTVGSGNDGRVVRYFNIESYFDPALGSLGAGDPNVYQGPDLTGFGSSLTVGEILWDIHDRDIPGFSDNDGIDAFPLFLTLRFMRVPRSGFSYPYLYTLLDSYVADGALSPVRINSLMQRPEDQGIAYPGTDANGFKWPRKVSPDLTPDGPIVPPFDKTVSDRIDTVTPSDPINVDLGIHTQRFFLIDVVRDFDIDVSLDTPGDFEVDITDLNNNVIESGNGGAAAAALPARAYLIRVRSLLNPQAADFDLRIRLTLASGP